MREIPATCVLITREGEYPQEVLDSLPLFNEVIIETECPSIYRRYELARKAKNNLIYVQDDDCTINVEELLYFYKGRLTNAITQHHKEYYAGMGVTLVGFGTFFDKRMIDFSPYLAKYPKDKLFLSQTDRIFTYLNRPFRSVVMDINQLPRGNEPNRMSTSSDHWDNLAKIRERLYNI
jgi:hypothetical protein